MLGTVLQRHFSCQTVDAAIAFRIDIHFKFIRAAFFGRPTRRIGRAQGVLPSVFMTVAMYSVLVPASAFS